MANANTSDHTPEHSLHPAQDAMPDSIYFAPILPWQQTPWQQLIARYDRLPHGLLFAGMQGIGKRAFVWRFVAWLLCDNRTLRPDRACGHCQSCHWLAAGTHPDLQVLPLSSLPVTLSEGDDVSDATRKKGSLSQGASSNEQADGKAQSIKVDDIRRLQPFITQGSTGRRVCVIDNADLMTVAAANALLKSLEEPREGVYILLISDAQTKLLPTIKSRVQKVAIDQIDQSTVQGYLASRIQQEGLAVNAGETSRHGYAQQVIKLANGAPLAALNMLMSKWYQQRDVWMKTWLALRVGKRSATAASDYWQEILTLDEFILLSEMMLMDMSRHALGIKPLQADIDLIRSDSVGQLNVDDIYQLMALIEDIKYAHQQNVQDKLGYDRLMSALADL